MDKENKDNAPDIIILKFADSKVPIKKSKVCCIYKITNPTGSVYIGKTVHFRRRYLIYKGLHCKNQHKLYRSFLKYGFENHSFEILHELPSDVSNEIISTYEILYISQYKSCGFDLMNLTDGGEGLLGKKHSEETKEKIRIKSSSRGFPEAARIAALEFHRGSKKSEETKKKVSEAMKGKKKSPEHVAKYRLRVGEKRSEEARKNISEAHKGQTPWNKGLFGYKQPRKKSK